MLFSERFADVLVSEHEEALVAAKEAFKNLVNACIDENLIKQGVDQVVVNSNEGTRKSAPTIIEKVCATVESLLDYQYAAVWDISFQIVSAMFDKLGSCIIFLHSCYLILGKKVSCDCTVNKIITFALFLFLFFKYHFTD